MFESVTPYTPKLPRNRYSVNSGSMGATGIYSVSSILATMNQGPGFSKAWRKNPFQILQIADRGRVGDAATPGYLFQVRTHCGVAGLMAGLPPLLVVPHHHNQVSGPSRPMLAIVPRFISREPSPSREITFSPVDRAIPRAIEEHKPILP